jgi:hypothetical protein
MKRKPIDPKSVFDLACKFAAAEQHLRHTSNPNAAYMASPSMVLSAFTIELFFKCLLLLEGKEIARTHSLDVLYQELSRSQRSASKRCSCASTGNASSAAPATSDRSMFIAPSCADQRLKSDRAPPPQYDQLDVGAPRSPP